MPKMRISCGPRGIIMTKSTATVNCTAASIIRRSHSLKGRFSESICRGGSAALNWVGEECAGVVKTATFDAELANVKTTRENSTNAPVPRFRDPGDAPMRAKIEPKSTQSGLVPPGLSDFV